MEIVILKRKRFRIPGTGTIRKWVSRCLERVEGDYSAAGLLFCGPRTMKRYQKEFRGKEGVTDVLSFPGEGGYLGDIVICVDRVEEQARTAGIRFEDEVKRMVVHGVLHCAGFNHEKDQGEMAALQEEILEAE